jgi:putative transposase
MAEGRRKFDEDFRQGAVRIVRETGKPIAQVAEAVAGVIFHTDQGSEYTAHRFRTACERIGIRQSMGRAGSALDNAVIESWHSTLEFERRSLEHFTSRAEARARVAAWIDDYNRHRRHSALQMRSPIDFELGPQAA